MELEAMLLPQMLRNLAMIKQDVKSKPFSQHAAAPGDENTDFNSDRFIDCKFENTLIYCFKSTKDSTYAQYH